MTRQTTRTSSPERRQKSSQSRYEEPTPTTPKTKMAPWRNPKETTLSDEEMYESEPRDEMTDTMTKTPLNTPVGYGQNNRGNDDRKNDLAASTDTSLKSCFRPPRTHEKRSPDSRESGKGKGSSSRPSSLAENVRKIAKSAVTWKMGTKGETCINNNDDTVSCTFPYTAIRNCQHENVEEESLCVKICNEVKDFAWQWHEKMQYLLMTIVVVTLLLATLMLARRAYKAANSKEHKEEEDQGILGMKDYLPNIHDATTIEKNEEPVENNPWWDEHPSNVDETIRCDCCNKEGPPEYIPCRTCGTHICRKCRIRGAIFGRDCKAQDCNRLYKDK